MTKNNDRQVKTVGGWNENVWHSDYQLSVAFKLNHRKRKNKYVKKKLGGKHLKQTCRIIASSSCESLANTSSSPRGLAMEQKL